MEEKYCKTKKSSGADEKTPSLPQYFSWINNTNEGSTEKQTLINLDYFKWLHDYYGMKIRIYAWDAGNLDGALDGYGKPGGEKLMRQFPNGYVVLVEKAREFGCSLGVWAGADGFGDTLEEEQERFNLMVGLCKEYGFLLFKFDTVCGALRKEKRDVFKRMIDECRKYVPGLIVLNHRNDFGEAGICATTSLWEGRESYIDVHMGNSVTAPHHRGEALSRGLAPDMKRLFEDHGVCISSCLDYFDDELIIQAFSRSLILAPEIYGNPWFLRDDEQAKLARIYNLHAKYADILVDGILLPESYGKYAVSRGNSKIRFITLRNLTWTDEKITISFRDTGISACEKVTVIKYHPAESYIGVFDYNDDIDITVPVFRSVLLAIFECGEFQKHAFAITDCEYEVVRETEGAPIELNILKTIGSPIKVIGGKNDGKVIYDGNQVIDMTHLPPLFLGRMNKCGVPDNAEQLYEAAMFKADNDSLESQSVKRSGDTAIPQVKAARDAFFAQDTYIYRGCESRSIFDGNRDTFFDAGTRYYDTRVNGGCLRIDFGRAYIVSKIEMEYFKIGSPVYEVPARLLPEYGEVSADLKIWNEMTLNMSMDLCECEAPVVKHSVHTVEFVKGMRERSVYSPKSGKAVSTRYFRLPDPMDRIYSVKIYDGNGDEIKIDIGKTHVNNMMAPYTSKQIKAAHRIEVKIPKRIKIEDGDYIAVAINGEHGSECAYCAAEDKNSGEPMGFTDRAVSYPVNNWEHIVCESSKNYTYYLKLCEKDNEREFIIYTLLTKESRVDCDVYFCEANRIKKGIQIFIT